MANATINLKALMDVSQAKGQLNQLQSVLNKLKMPQGIGNQLNKQISQMASEIANIERISAKGTGDLLDANTIIKSGNKILNLFDKIQTSVKSLGNLSDADLKKLFPDSAVRNISQAQTALKQYDQAIKQHNAELKKQAETEQDLQNKLQKAQKAYEAASSKKAVTSNTYNELKKQISEKEKEIQDYERQKEQWRTRYGGLGKGWAKGAGKELEQAQLDKDALSKQLDNLIKIEDLEKVKQALISAQEALKTFQNTANQASDNNAQKKALDDLFTALSKIKGIKLDDFTRDIDGAKKAIAQLTTDQLEELQNGFKSLETSTEGVGESMDQLRPQLEGAADSVKQLSYEAQELEQLKTRLKAFFGISNAINIFQRSIKDAYNTITELDAAMTQTAVVTDWTVGDMWKQLPTYAAEADKLGATILGAYNTMTLYYQQGLKADEAWALGTETMKMARIANLDYTESTNMMTAAIRGFNMELSQVSAQRVNDVYSELAAISASDTEEISTAMTKTASLAHNANMEFETTSAFLAQIIETTRESAETAGTALKTVIARFTELKKDPSLIGEVDGEVVDANKIETALKSIGVSLRDAQGEFRNLDEVFLDISRRWDGLTTNQQRYIATMAAGSRQQSRFIAMMSDYERTMELVNAANNSAGASQKQFEKTLDSLEAKLNKLKNAWDLFTMGLADDALVKGAVNTLTLILTTVNKITDALGGGMLSSIARVAIALNALKLGKLGFNWMTPKLSKASSSPIGQLLGKILGLDLFSTKTKDDKGAQTFKNTVVEAGKQFAALVNGSAVAKGRTEAASSGAGSLLGKISGSVIKEFLKSNALIMGIIALVATTAFSIWLASDQRKMKKAVEQSEKASDKASKDQENYTQAKDLYSQYLEKQKAILDATTQSQRQEAIQANNDFVNSLKETELNLPVEFKDGILTVEPGKFGDKVDELKDTLNNSNFVAALSQSKVTALKAASQPTYADVKKSTFGQSYVQSENAWKAQQAKTQALEQQTNSESAYAFSLLLSDSVKQAGWGEELAKQFANTLDETKLGDEEAMAALATEFQTLQKDVAQSPEIKALLRLSSQVSAGTFNGDIASIVNSLGLDTSSKTFTDIFGTRDIISELQAQQQQLLQSSAQYVATSIGSFGLTDAEIQNIVSSMSPEILKATETMLKQVAPLGENAAAAIWDNIEGIATDAEGMKNLFKDIDFSNPIQASTQLNQIMKEGSDSAKALATDLLSISQNALGSKAQLQYLLASDSYSKITSDVKDLIDENGKLTADNIYELADSCSVLDDLLEEGTLSAETLANILTGLETGTLTFEDLNDEVLKLVGNMETLEGKTSAAKQAMLNFSEGEDYKEGLDFINERLERINELALENWELGNKNLQSNLQALLTPEAYSNLYSEANMQNPDQLHSEIQMLYDSIMAYTANGGQGFADLLTNNQLLNENNGIYSLNERFTGFSDFWNQLTGVIEQTNLGLNEDAITMLLNSYRAQDPYVDQQLGRLERQEAYGKLEGKSASVQDINTLATVFNISPEQIQTELKGYGFEVPATLKFVDESGQDLTGRSLYDELFPILSQSGLMQEKTVDFDAFSSLFESKGATEAQIREFANYMGETYGVTFTKSVQTYTRDALSGALKTESTEAKGTSVEALEMDVKLKQDEAINTLQDSVSGIKFDTFQTNGQTAIAAIAGQVTTIQTALNSLHLPSLTFGGKAATGTGATGGFVSRAKGTLRQLRSGLALTGEEDPEIVWNKEDGYAYIAGENGPEFNYLYPGDRVFDAQETKQILRRKGPSLASGGFISAAGRFPTGTTSSGGSKKPSSAREKSSSEKTPNEWKNDFDWLYNLVEDIAELERQQSLLQQKYESYLKDIAKNGSDLVAITREQITNLMKQYNKQEFQFAKRQQEMSEYLAKYVQYSQYGTYNSMDNTIEIDWDAIEAIQDEDYYKKVEDYVKGLEDIQDKLDDAEEALLDIDSQIQEMQQRFIETYISAQDRVAQALVSLREAEIENLSNINSSIKDSNSKLLSSISKTLSKQRQDRSNSKTEDQIGQLERRIAYLRQDTSLNNDLQIKQLEDELADLKEDYTDTLIDQKLDVLQEQEDYAAEQRERQIALMQSQLDFQQKTGELWEKVNKLIEDAMGDGGQLLQESELINILKTSTSETWQGLSDANKQLWEKELINQFKEVFAYLEMGSAIGIEDYGKTVQFIDGLGRLQEGLVDITGKTVTASGQAFSGIIWDPNSKQWITLDTGSTYVAPSNTLIPSYSQAQIKNQQGSTYDYSTSTGVCADCTASCMQDCMNSCRGFCEGSCQSTCGGECKYSCGTQANKDAYAAAGYQYATGGLADYTGLAWLDGSPSQPELVLNAKDTANFIELKNILSSILTGNNNSSDNSQSGDNYFDITINATLEDDYDVDKLVRKIKTEIYRDGSYRGVNVIRKIR